MLLAFDPMSIGARVIPVIFEKQTFIAAFGNIFVSIADESAHSEMMHGDAIDRMVTYSFWA